MRRRHRWYPPVAPELCVGVPYRRFLFGGTGLAAAIRAMGLIEWTLLDIAIGSVDAGFIHGVICLHGPSGTLTAACTTRSTRPVVSGSATASMAAR